MKMATIKKIIGMAGVAAVVIFLTSPPISAGEIRRDTRKIRADRRGVWTNTRGVHQARLALRKAVRTRHTRSARELRRDLRRR